MEEGTTKAPRDIIKIVITGPESTGKSTLARDLAEHYHSIFIPEYAREYIGKLNRPYLFEDVEHIAKHQVEEIDYYMQKADKVMFLDTHLIITKVWFDIVFGRCPAWISDQLRKKEMDLFLLCSTDLPWEPDNVRENGGEMRQKLFSIYKTELENFGFQYRIIEGFGEKRLENALHEIDLFLTHNI